MSKVIGRGRYATSTYPGRDGAGAPTPPIPLDHKVLVDGSDTTPGFLGVKVAQGGNVQLTILNPGGDEQLEISVPNADHKFSINGADATADFAEQKLVPGANMAVTVVDLGGGNLVLSFAAVVPAGASDHKVIVDLADTTPNYLSGKLTAAGGIALNILNPAGNEQIEIDATNVPGDHKVLVDGADTTPGYLNDKLTTTGSIVHTILNPATDEQLNQKVGSFIDLRDEPYYARIGAIGTTCTTVGGNANVTLTSAVLQEHDGVCIFGAGALTGFTTPAAPTAALGSGVLAGTTQREYKIVAVGEKLGYTAASTSVSIANAPDICGVSSLSVPYEVDTESEGDIANFNAVPTMMNRFELVVNSEFVHTTATNPVNNGVYTITAVNGSTCVATRSATWAAGFGIFPAAAKNTGIYVRRGNNASYIYRVLTFGTIGVASITFGLAPYVEVTPKIVDTAIRLSANVANLAATPKTWSIAGGGTYTLAPGDLVLVQQQTTSSEDGIYVVGAVGTTASLTRAPAYDSAAELPQGLIVRATRDATGVSLFDFDSVGGSFWVLTNVVTTVGVDPITFAQQDIRWFAVYARTGGAGNYVFRGSICANPYWAAIVAPFPVVYRDYGGKMTLQGYGWASSSHAPSNGRLPLNAPAVEGAGFHRAIVTSVVGNTVTLDVAPTTSAVGAAIRLDNYQAITDAIADFGSTNEGGELFAYQGIWQIYGDILVDKNITVRGPGKRRGTYFQFGDGFNLRFLGNQQTSGGTTAEGSTFYGINVTVENKSLPQGARYARTNVGDPLNRAPAFGAAIHVQAPFVSFNGCSTIPCGSSIVFDGRDSANSLADECYVTECNFGNAANGHGMIATGANANACNIQTTEIDICDGDAILDAGFLNNTWEDYAVTIALGFTTFSTNSSTFTGGYYEDSRGNIFIDRNARLVPMFMPTAMINPRVYDTGVTPNIQFGIFEQGNFQTPTRFGRINGGFMGVFIGEAAEASANDTVVLHALSRASYPGLKLDHQILLNPLLDDGDGALTFFWKESAYSGLKWAGANPKGSGLPIFPRGYLVRDVPSGFSLRSVRACATDPTAQPGWYQKGDIVWTLSGGFNGAKYENLLYTVIAEFGIASVAWSISANAVVGNTFLSGNRVWLVQSISDNAEAGVLGGVAPVVGADFSTQVNGTTTLYQLPNGSDAAQVPNPFISMPNLSPQSLTISSGVNASLGPNSPLCVWASGILNDITLTLLSANAKYGDRIRVFGANNLGPKHAYIKDGPSGNVIAVMPQSTPRGIEAMFNGTNWILVGGFGIDSRFRNEADRTALAAIVADIRGPANFVKLTDDWSQWSFDSAYAGTDATGLVVTTPSAGTGAWLRSDSTLDLKIAISKNTANATALWTVPTGYRYAVIGSHWEVTGADWVGIGAIGLSSSNTKFNTQGDLLGGPTGDVAAELTLANLFCGTVGPKVNLPRTVLVAGDTIRYDLFGAAFTTGAGFAHIRLQRIP